MRASEKVEKLTAPVQGTAPGNNGANGADHEAILGRLEELVRSTYLLWDEEWVGFNWRNYTFEHVKRVRALSRLLGTAEGADALVLEYASLLHDITKGYDGEILMKDGQRVLDANGLWRNRVLAPARRNLVTDLYDEMGLGGLLHNESGARMADALMAGSHLPAHLRERVSSVILAHLRPGEHVGVEERVLYDADTIDANIGLPAIHRHLYIVLHREEVQRGEDFAGWVGGQHQEFLNWYLRERVPSWLSGKRQDFLGRLTTDAGRRIGEERLDNLLEKVNLLTAELTDLERNLRSGALAVMGYLIDNRFNPRMSHQMSVLLSTHFMEDGPAREARRGDDGGDERAALTVDYGVTVSRRSRGGGARRCLQPCGLAGLK